MEPKKPFSAHFTVPSVKGDIPADTGPLETFELLQAAAVAHTPGAVCNAARSEHNNSSTITDSSGAVIGHWQKV